MADDGRAEGEPRSHFAMIPRMANHDLDIHEYRLYGHYSDVCGQESGRCFQSIETIRRIIHMSPSAIAKARKGLEGKGYIAVNIPDGKARNQGMNISVSLVDRWQENAERFKEEVKHECESANVTSVNHLKHEMELAENHFVPVQEEVFKQDPLKAETEQIPAPVSVDTLPEQNAVIKVYKPPTTFEETKADTASDIMAMADDLFTRAQPGRPFSKRVEITPDGMSTGARFIAHFGMKKLDDDTQQQIQKLINRFGMFALTETLKKLDPAKANRPIGLLTWTLEDLERKDELPKLLPYIVPYLDIAKETAYRFVDPDQMIRPEDLRERKW